MLLRTLKQARFKLHGRHQLLFYADDVNLFSEKMHTTRGKTERIKIANKKDALTWVCSCLVNRMQKKSRTKVDNKYFVNVTNIKCLVTTITKSKLHVKKKLRAN